MKNFEMCQEFEQSASAFLQWILDTRCPMSSPKLLALRTHTSFAVGTKYACCRGGAEGLQECMVTPKITTLYLCLTFASEYCLK